MNVKGVSEVLDVKVRSYGGYYIIVMNILVNNNLTVKEAHIVTH